VGTTKKIILVNTNWVVDILLKALSPLLPTEVNETMSHFKVGDMEGLKKELLKTIDIEDIPEEFGGLAVVTSEDYNI